MNANEFFDRLAKTRVLIIIRLESVNGLHDLAAAVAASNVLMEVSLTTPGALEWLANDRPPNMVIGAGTVRGVDNAEAAIAAGADFLVSPHFDAAVVQAAVNADIAAMPGAWTASEAVAGVESGAAAIKLFPASLGGPGYLRALRGPLPDVAFVPVGGIDETNATDYLRAGAIGVGIGSALINDEVVARADWTGLTRKLNKFVNEWAETAT